MITEVVLPQLGETVSEATIVSWLAAVGDEVVRGQPLVEVSSDKVDTEVPSPVAGVVHQLVVPEGETVDVGTLLARIGDVGSVPASAVPAASAASDPLASVDTSIASSSGSAAKLPAESSNPTLSPVVRRLIKDNNLEASKIVGTGSGGRVTRRDVEDAIADGSASTEDAAVDSAAGPTDALDMGQHPVTEANRGAALSVDDIVIPMSHIRKQIGQHMVMTKATSPHVLTAIEVDFERIERVRTRNKESWRKEEGSSLTYLPFICRAVVDALKLYPNINASVGDGELIVHKQVNLAFAVDLNFNGLVAPVVRQANGKRLRAIAQDIVDLATRAKHKQLGADELKGGTFTITNPGQYGTLMQFPLINQPQVAILSTDGVRRKPVVVTDQDGNEAITIHSTGVLALAWDHRAFDGAYVAAFLDKVRQVLETRDWEGEIA